MIQDVRVGIRDEEWNGCGSFDGNGRIQDTENGLRGVLLPDTSPREELHHPTEPRSLCPLGCSVASVVHAVHRPGAAPDAVAERYVRPT